jgi:hypothetical protein
MTMRSVRNILVLATATVLSALPAELKPTTLAAFDRYVQLTEVRMADEIRGTSPLLWVDRQSEPDRAQVRQRLGRGEVVVERMETRDGKNGIDVPSGLIHHWVGTVLMPGVPLERVIAVVQDYPRYPERFGPTIIGSRVLKHAGDHFEVAMRTWSKKMMVTVVIDADYLVDYQTIRPGRVWTKSVATHVAEVQSAGRADERSKPGDQASGFLWRFNNYCAFEQKPEGTYEQCESISLTRDLPFGIGWMIKPFVSGIPRETMAFTLGAVRAAASR